MDMTNSFVSVGHGCSFPETKRYNNNNKAADPDMNGGDFLGIDDLLDFSNDDIGGPIECCQSNAPTTIPPSDINLGSCNSSKTSSAAPSVFEGGELCVPFDDLAELEWLSNFVEESFSSSDAPANAFLSSSITGASGLEGEKTHHGLTTASPVSILDGNHACNSTKHSTASFTSELYVPGRARSKRCRTAVCFWNTRILSADDASASILNETCSTSTLQSSDSDTNFAYEQSGEADSFSAPNKLSNHRSNSDYFSATNKYNHRSNCKRLAAQESVSGARRCVHCGVQKTPQWRAGPEGPKTLCNACGVRYKSGRLLPEYRPAASPTFIESIHSNSHRRVMEMRRQREQEENEEHEASASASYL